MIDSVCTDDVDKALTSLRILKYFAIGKTLVDREEYRSVMSNFWEVERVLEKIRRESNSIKSEK